MNQAVLKKVELANEARNFYRIVLQLIRANKSVALANETGISVRHSHFLSELDACPTADINGLAEILSLDRSTVSRTAKKLESLGYLKSKPSKNDSRKLEFKITAEGRKLMKAIDTFADSIINKRCKRLSSKEILLLKEYQKRLGDALNLPITKARSEEHIFRTEQRRLTRGFKLLSDYKFTEQLSNSERMVLVVLEESFRPLSASEISDELGLQRSAVSKLTKDLFSEKLISHLDNPKDRRSELYLISDKGKNVLELAERSTVEIIEKAFKNFSKRERQGLVELFKKYAGYPTKKEFNKTYTIKKILSEADSKQARNFYLERLIDHGRIESVPAVLFDGNLAGFSLSKNGEILAVLQLSKKARRLKIEIIESLFSREESLIERFFVAEVFKKLKISPPLQCL